MSAAALRELRFPALAIDQVAEALDQWPEGSAEPLVNFAPGQSGFDVWRALGEDPPALPIERVVRYGDLAGSWRLRQQISQGLSRRFGVDVAPTQVCITNGGSEAIMLALHLLLQPGHELLMGRTCYPAYRPLHRLFGAKRTEVAVRPDGCLDMAALTGQVKGRDQVLLVNSPGNPLGGVMGAGELAELAELPIPIIFDEVYQPLSLTKESVPSAMAYTDRHFVLGSFAKSLAVPGLRLGYLVSPREYADEVVNIKALLSVCSSFAAQYVMEHLLVHWDDLEGLHRAYLRHNHAHFTGCARDLGLQFLTQPQAGLFAALALPADLGSDSLGLALVLAREYGIGVVPSADFQDQGPAFLRMNYSIQPEQIEPGLQRLAAAVRRLSAC